jgi:hypothetical protein
MCGPTAYKRRYACGHRLPLEPCDDYAHGLSMCLADPSGVRKFRWHQMVRVPRSDEPCRFCKENRDIDGAWAFGVKWVDAYGRR